MSFGDCIDQTLNNIVTVLTAPDAAVNAAAFVNPQAGYVTSILSGGSGATGAILTLLGDPFSGMTLIQANSCVALYNAISSLCGGHSISITGTIAPYTVIPGATVPFPVMNQYHELCQFMSGKTSIFPGAAFDPGLGVPNMAIIGGLTFIGLIGVGRNAQATEANLCQTDPNDPCRKLSAIFGPILGLFNTLLQALIDAFATFIDFINHSGDYLAIIAAAIAAILNIIKNVLGAIIGSIFDSIRLGLAKMFSNLDPCLRLVMQNIAGPDLAAAIGL